MRWRFPIAFAQAIRFHHRIGEVTGEVQPLARTVGLASTVASVLAPKSKPETVERFYAEAREWFGIQKSEAEALLSGIVVLARDLSDTFDLETGESPDVDAILAAQNRRDEGDRIREVGAMKPAADALLVETDGLTQDEVVERLVRLIEERRQPPPA